MNAPEDLQHLTDQFESLPFRRRGYERDALLQLLIARAGYKHLLTEHADETEEEKLQLATLPDLSLIHI